MNKKIKIIDLLNKIANGEEVPQEIKINTRIFNFCDTCKTYEDEYERDLVIKWDELNREVEILEDNTEEIEELFGNVNAIIDKLKQMGNAYLYQYLITRIASDDYCNIESYKEYKKG